MVAELPGGRAELFEKRRQLAEAWARFCCGGPPADDVVELQAAG